MAGELSQDEQYAEELQQLVNERALEEYSDQDPMVMAYMALADMVVLCTRLYISLRRVEAEFDQKIAKYMKEHGNG